MRETVCFWKDVLFGEQKPNILSGFDDEDDIDEEEDEDDEDEDTDEEDEEELLFGRHYFVVKG